MNDVLGLEKEAQRMYKRLHAAAPELTYYAVFDGIKRFLDLESKRGEESENVYLKQAVEVMNKVLREIEKRII